MRTHLAYICIIAALLFFGWLGWKTLQKNRAEITRLNGNVFALVQDTSEKAAKLIVSRDELEMVSKEKDSVVKAYEKKTGGRVREIHTVDYIAASVVHDTLFVDTVADDFCLKPMVWEFPHGCVTNIVTYDPLNNGITDSLFGEIRIDRYLLAEKPRWIIFKPRYWKKENWPTSVRVENNCGLQIKENTIFEVH